jgi:hypothetical protein
MIQTTRVSLRLERATIGWAAALAAVLVLGMLVAVAGMLAVVGGRDCDVDFTGAECAGIVQAFAPWEQAGQFLIGLLWVIPTGFGALLGVAITAGEIERRSAQISWPLARSRARWLLVRVAPVALALVVLLTILAGVAELLTRERLMTDDAGFHDYQLRSLLVPVRALLGLGVGLAVGAAIGRTLPSLLVSLVLAAAMTAGAVFVIDTWHIAWATLVPMDDPSWDTAVYPLVVIQSAVSGPAGESFLTIPASDFWVWVLREAGVLMVAAIVASLTAVRIIDRRSP